MSERRPAASTPDGAVLLHGISRTARSFRRMELALRDAGFATLNLDYDSRRKGLDALAEDIHPSLDRFTRSLDGSVHFVCHSMGGRCVSNKSEALRPQAPEIDRRSVRCVRHCRFPAADQFA